MSEGPAEFSLMQASWAGRFFRRELVLSVRGVTFNGELLVPAEQIIAFGLVPVPGRPFQGLHLWHKGPLAQELPGFLRRGRKGLSEGEIRLFWVADDPGASGFRTRAHVERLKQFVLAAGIGRWQDQ
ncbi:hypothetical protein [Actinocorallia populi]|uniref:hypothetical protein n=1 Tax=Actinocorallia populi TaxID=2079200 RepID=UPI000D086A0E|nr:hypothetical protein [Actinocorallia populi]